MFLILTKTLTLLISLYSSFPSPDVSLLFVHLSLPKLASRSQRSLNLLPCSLSLSTLGSSLFGFSEQAREAWWCTKSRLLLLFSVCGLGMTYSYRLGGAVTSPARPLPPEDLLRCLSLGLRPGAGHLQQTSMQKGESCSYFL